MQATDVAQTMALAYAAQAAGAARNRLHAARLDKAGRKDLARLLTALADADEIQARRTLMYLRGKLDDSGAYVEALPAIKQQAAAGEYPQLAAALSAAGQAKAAEAFEQFARVAGNHAERLGGAGSGERAAAPVYYVCQVCGYIAEDDAPAQCPVCGAVQSKFARVP
jgi:rubrerythrin